MPGNCLACHTCCSGLTVYLSRDDFLHIGQEYIDYTHGRPHMRQRPNHIHTCVALDPATGICGIYADRPSRCRIFNEDGARCRKWRQGKWPRHD